MWPNVSRFHWVFIEVEDNKTWERATQKAVSEATGIPRRFISKALAMFPECRHGRDQLNWNRLQPLYEQNRDEIETEDTLSIDGVKKANLLKDGILKDIAIQKARNELIERELVKALLGNIASAQDSLLNSKLRQELPAKARAKGIVSDEVGLRELIDQALNEIFGVMQGELSKWK